MTEHTESSKRRTLSRIARRLPLPRRRPQERPVPPADPAAESGTPVRGDRLILAVAVLVLLGVAGAAGYVSYHHFYGLAIALGEQRDMAVLYPAMSDGVIVMASLVMVYCSRRGMRVPLLAKAALGVGGVVTLVANVAHGWGGGMGTRLLSALAPVAFVGAYELLMWLVRTARKRVQAAETAPVEEHVCRPVEVPVEVEREVPVLPVDRYEAARLTYEESLQPGRKRLGRRALANRWGLEQREAEEIIAEVERERAESAAPDTSETAPDEPPVPPRSDAGDTGTPPSPEVRRRIAQMRDNALLNSTLVPSVNGSSATGTEAAE